MVTESVIVPSYNIFTVGFEVGARDEQEGTYGMTAIFKELIKMELA
jgi:hypothetical protein